MLLVCELHLEEQEGSKLTKGEGGSCDENSLNE